MPDPIFVEVLGSYLLSAAEEMTAAMVRSAYSPAIRDRRDCSSALLTTSGEIIAQASDIPVHLGSLVGIVSDAIEHFGLDRLQEGDVLLANDPYQGSSTHLNDITVVAPVFFEREIVAYACVTAHHSDVGGMSPGSETLEAKSILQEGIRLPCLPVYRDGGPVKEVISLVVLNSRTPEERAGDLRAQIGAVIKGRHRFMEVIAKYGCPNVLEGMRALLDHTEARFRARLAALPDGDFAADEELNPERESGRTVRIAVAVRKTGESITLDFTETSPQVPEGRNVPYGGLLAAVHYAVRALVDPEMPANDGFFRAVEIVAPKGVLVNAASPFPVSLRVSTSQHIASVIFKAVAEGWPDRVVAGCDGRRKVIFSGTDARTGRFFVYHETNAGGVGAHAMGDGIDGAMAHVIQVYNMPVEVLELTYPLAVKRLELMRDSGGVGRWRGGAGVRRDYVALIGPTYCTLISERSNFRMWGLHGGEPGQSGRFVLNPDTPHTRILDSIKHTSIVLQAGDVLSVQTTGAGGFGDPLQRSIELVVKDVLEGRISPQSAKKWHRVRLKQQPDGHWVGERMISKRDNLRRRDSVRHIGSSGANVP